MSYKPTRHINTLQYTEPIQKIHPLQKRKKIIRHLNVTIILITQKEWFFLSQLCKIYIFSHLQK